MIVREALEAATAALDAAGCGTPKLDAELLIADALESRASGCSSTRTWRSRRRRRA